MRSILKSVIAIISLFLASPANSQESESATARSPGALIAIAGDCAGCHFNPDGGSEYSGGLVLQSPMGGIYARNITPDKETGIGDWTLADFDRALRKGKSKTVGHLYPAMPYTSYRYMRDEDVASLYDYFMNEVEPVKNKVPETTLGFPFLRVSMAFWDPLFGGSGKAPKIANANTQVQRGQYLVDVLGHCGECHTPRGSMMQVKAKSEHLAGAKVGGWYAPNISSSPSGIGDWPEERLKTFLKYGKVDQVNAGGDMGLAVQMSLSKLPEEDIDAMVAYLKSTTPVAGAVLAPIVKDVSPVDLTDTEPQNGGYETFADTSGTDGAVLYLSACAACHGVDGSLKSGGGPNLSENGSVRTDNPINVVQTIAHGLNLGALDRNHLMPSFRSVFNDAQIASVASYVRMRFGGLDSRVSETQVTRILAGQEGVPWLISNARWLAWLGIIAGGIVALGGSFFLLRRPRKKVA